MFAISKQNSKIWQNRLKPKTASYRDVPAAVPFADCGARPRFAAFGRRRGDVTAKHAFSEIAARSARSV